MPPPKPATSWDALLSALFPARTCLSLARPGPPISPRSPRAPPATLRAFSTRRLLRPSPPPSARVLPPHRAFSESPAPPPPPDAQQGLRTSLTESAVRLSVPEHLDRPKLISRLESAGFSPSQAEAILSALADSSGEYLSAAASGMVPKHFRESQLDDPRPMDSLRERVVGATGSEAEAVRKEVARIRAAAEALSKQIPEAVQRSSSGIKLDLNLERGRIRDEERELERQIAAAAGKLDARVDELRARINGIQKEVDETLFSFIGIAVTLFFLWKVFNLRSTIKAGQNQAAAAAANGNGAAKPSA
ncbi:hypothetical protein DFJ74DRAFT_664443 [Hyaloraphidium curvatum]|nr:hypothetical protein DFJ74DRAFT_664443 [Hyaloraphidium curvatum]